MNKEDIDWIKGRRTHEELYNKWYETYRSYILDKNKDAKKFMKLIERVIDDKNLDKEDSLSIKKDYHSYPDYSDKDFNTEISKKAEFFHCKGLLNLIDLEDRCLSTNFELGNHQNFLKNFMNRNTPYQSLLIFHGVGVGKTCTAITISNSFIDLYKKEDKKIICLVSKNIQANWMNTVYNPEKGENQCNGESFQSIIGTINKKVNTSGRVKKLIKEYYEFYGYQQFSNKVKKLIQIKQRTTKNKTTEEIEKTVIHNYFSNRVLIIDEVHNLRDENLDNFSKSAVIFLDKVVRYSTNLRLIVMSATPMFNRATEIQWILNLLLKNDKRPTISNKVIFDEKENLTEKGMQLLQKKIRGYVSYVRGENPVTFPIRLYPEGDPLCIKEYPKKDLYGGDYGKDTYQFKFLKMYFNEMKKDGYQAKVYEKYIESLNYGSNIPITETTRGIQISNIVFPSIDIFSDEDEITEDNFSKNYGGSALFKLVQNKKNVHTYHKKFRTSKGFVPIFDLKHIGSISSKIHNLLHGFKKEKPKGIIFIYSEFLPSGIIPLALALETMGFEKYSGNLWHDERDDPIDFEWNPMKKGSKNARYIILSGNKNLSPNNDEEIKELISDKNIQGERIKIVIGSVVAAEGLDLRNIREIHLLDPWFHLSRVEQIIGRGIRYCSHTQLKKEERNVTVYQHVAGLEKDVESIDTYTYRKAEEKAVVIGQVENILKENAVDCYLNQQINQINKKKLLPVNLVTSRNHPIPDFEVHDKMFSKVCSYTECGYKCNCNEITEKDINYDTFTMENSKYLFTNIQKIIIELYELRNYYTLDELQDRIMETTDTNTTIIYYTLYHMIDQEIPIWNKEEKVSGYLINKNEYYLFQPDSNGDRSAPLYYRGDTGSIDTQKYLPLEGDLFGKQSQPDHIYTYDEVIFTEEDIKEEYSLKDYIPHFKEGNYFDNYVDNLLYEEKVVLLKDIVKEYIDTQKIKDRLRLRIFEYFRHNLIYSRGIQYSLFENKLKNVVGFFLMNTLQFMKKKKRGIQELEEIENDYSYFIYKNDTFYETSELDDGNLIKMSIKTNFLKKKEQVNILKTESVWGYPFIMENGSYAFKLVDEKLWTPNKLPGRIIGQIANKNNLRQNIIKEYFLENYAQLLKQDPKLEKDKHFLCLFIEMILRNKEKSKRSKHVLVPYDLVFLKYIY